MWDSSGLDDHVEWNILRGLSYLECSEGVIRLRVAPHILKFSGGRCNLNRVLVTFCGLPHFISVPVGCCHISWSEWTSLLSVFSYLIQFRFSWTTVTESDATASQFVKKNLIIKKEPYRELRADWNPLRKWPKCKLFCSLHLMVLYNILKPLKKIALINIIFINYGLNKNIVLSDYCWNTAGVWYSWKSGSEISSLKKGKLTNKNTLPTEILICSLLQSTS